MTYAEKRELAKKLKAVRARIVAAIGAEFDELLRELVGPVIKEDEKDAP